MLILITNIDDNNMSINICTEYETWILKETIIC